jgi:hypothetical protein
MTWIVLGVLALWLAALTIIVAALSRNVAAIQMAHRAGPVPVATVDLDQNGPDAGVPVPADLLALAQVAAPDADKLLVFMSPGCGTCLEVAEELAKDGTRGEDLSTSLLFVVVGAASSQGVQELREILARTGAPLVDGDDARRLMRELGVGALPYAVRLTGAQVSESRYLRRAADIHRVLTA